MVEEAQHAHRPVVLVLDDEGVGPARILHGHVHDEGLGVLHAEGRGHAAGHARDVGVAAQPGDRGDVLGAGRAQGQAARLDDG